MSKFSNTIEYNLRTTLDASGLNKLKGELGAVSTQLDQLGKRDIISSKGVKDAQGQISKVSEALTKAMNPSTGLINISTFKKELGGLSLSSLEKSMSQVGAEGSKAFGNIIAQVGKMDTSTRSISNFADKIFNTMGNTVRWGVTAGIFQSITNDLSRSVEYVKSLDTSLNNIRIVTGASNDNMREFAKTANTAAQSLGSSTVSFTDAAQLFAQNGFNEEDYTRLAEITQKVANVTQQDTTTVSEQITSLMEGYHMSIDEVEDSLSGMSVVAAASASDLEELATAEQKVASTASTLGVSQEQLTAQIGTIVSVTRQAPESVGNALRTMYARIADLKMGDTLEDGVSLGKVSKQLSDIGIQVLDETGNLRNLGDVLEELQGKWGDLSNAQQVALGTTLAGKYQLNPFMALMENSDMYQDQYKMMTESAGALDEQQSIYMDSIQARLQSLQTTGEGVINSLFNPDDFKPFISGLIDVLKLIQQFVDALGGADHIMNGLGATAVKVFSNQIGQTFSNVVSNFVKRQGQKRSAEDVVTSLGAVGKNSAHSDSIDFVNNMLDKEDSMSLDQREAYNKALETTVKLENQVVDAKKNQVAAQKTLNDYLLHQTDEESLSVKRAIAKSKGSVEASKEIEQYAKKVQDRRDKLEIGAKYLRGRLNYFSSDKLEEKDKKLFTTTSKKEEPVGINLSRRITSSLSDKGVFGALKAAGADVDSIKEKISNLGTVKTFSELKDQAKNILPILEEIIKALDSTDNKSKELEGAISTLGDATQELKRSEMALDSQKNANVVYQTGVDLQTKIAAVTTLAGSIGQLAFAWQSFQSLGSLMENDDLSSTEKAIQTISLLAFTLPTLIDSIIGFQESLGGAKALVIDAANALLGFEGSFFGVEAASNLAAGGVTTFGTAVLTLLPQIAAVAAVLGLVAGALYAAWSAYTQDARAAEEAAKASERFAQVTSATKSEADSLKSSIESYQTARSAVNDLTEGTQDWKDALKESNDQVIKLLDSYPELAKYISRGKGGLLTISDEGLAAAQDAEERQVAAMNAASNMLQNRASEAQSRSDMTELLRSISYQKKMPSSYGGYDSLGTNSGYSATAYDDRANGTTLQTVNLSEDDLNSVLGLIRSQGEQAVYNKEAVANALSTDVSDPIVQAITDNASRIINFNSSADSNRAADRIRSQQNVQNALNAQSGYDANNPNNDALVSYLTMLTDENSEAYQSALNSLQTADMTSILKQYQDITGDSYSEVEGDHAQFTTSDGNSYTVYEDDMKAAIALNQVLNDTAGNWKDLLQQIAAVTNSSLGQSYEGLSTVVTGGTKEDGFDFSSMSDSDMLNLYNNSDSITADALGVNDDFAQKMGYQDAQDYVNAFKEGLSEQTRNLRDLNELLNDGTVEGDNQTSSMDDEQKTQFVLDNVQAVYQLKEAQAEGLITGDKYTEGVTKLASEFPELNDQVNDLRTKQNKLNSVQEDSTHTAEDLQKATIDVADAQADLEDAIQTKKWNKAREALEDYSDALKESDEQSEDYQQATKKVASTLSDLTGKDISTDWVNNNLQAVQDWLDGVEGAGAKLDALLNIDNASANFKQQLASVGGSYDQLRAAIANNSITFDMNGYADFSQVDNALGILSDKTNDTTANLDLLAAYLQALGGASLTLEKDGQSMSIPAPPSVPNVDGSSAKDASAAMGKYANSLKEWESKVSEALNQGWSFKGIDLPDSTRKIGTSNSGGGSGSGGSGGGGGGGGSHGGSGGGGGSGSSYTPKSKDPVKDAIDRYERVNAELNTLDNTLDKISDNQDRVVGFQIADNISQQISLIKQQIEWTKKKMDIQKDEAAEYRNELASTYGLMYDAEGHITNYADVYKSLLNNLNGLINQYNADTTEAGQEALEKQIDTAQKSFDNFSDLVGKYDDLVSSSILESEKDIQDYYDKIEDLQIEAFQKTVDSVDNIKDLQDSLIEFNAVFSGLDSDSPFRKMSTSLEKLKTYWDVNTKSVGAYYDELISRNKEAMKSASEQQKQNLEYQNQVLEAARKQYGKGTLEVGGTGLFDIEMANLNTMLDQIDQFEKTGTSTIFGENSGSMYEVAKDIFDSATDLVKDYEGEIDDLHDAILDAIDDIADRMDERLDAFDNINDSLDHYADIIESIQGDKSYDQLNQNSQAMITNNEAAINELKQHIAIWQDLLGSLKEGSEEWKSVNEKINDAQQDILDRTKDTVDELLEVYERGVDKILDKWTQSTGMGDDLDWMSEQWELINRNADYYLDDVNSAYQIQKLQGKYLDLLDNANGLDIQNQITDQMKQQLGYLREKDKLSEYDVQYANAQLEILQKTIALQDAERNKSQLKLKRDTQGNYSYVYKANEDNVRSAQSDLLDAQNNAYNLSKDQMKQTQDDSLSALQDARDTISQIWTNANLTLEEKTKRTQVVIDSLKEYLASTSEQLSTSEKNIINDFLGMCEILTGENADKLKDVYDQIKKGNNDAFDQIDTRWQTSITTWLQNMDKFNASTDAAFKNLVDNFNSHKTQLDELGKTSNMTFDNMSDSIQGAVDKTNALVDSTGAFLNQLKNDSGVVKEYEKNLASMTEKIQNAENGMRAYQEQVNKLQQDLTAKEQENANLQSRVNALEAEKNGGPGGGAGGGAGGAGGGANSDTAWGIAKAIWTYGAASGWGDDPTRSGKLKKAYGDDFAREVQSIINQNYRSNKLVDFGSMKYSSYNLVGYRTGGYTGDDWSASEKQAGKIGLLHEKELILNKTDTENILNAVDMVRSMVALGRNGNYNDLIRQSGNVVDMASVVKPLEGGSGSIYNVECTFPNATNVDEIQRAILTLPDIAPQYAYKY